MFNLAANPSKGIPLEAYIDQQENPRIKRYPSYEVESAIESLVPNHPRPSSDSTLEAIISILHYPKLLGLLVNGMSAVSCSFRILENYGNSVVSHCPLTEGPVSTTNCWDLVVLQALLWGFAAPGSWTRYRDRISRTERPARIVYQVCSDVT